MDLKGYEVRAAENLATVAQVYRNPLFETFRYILVKNGEVVWPVGFEEETLVPNLFREASEIHGFLSEPTISAMILYWGWASFSPRCSIAAKRGCTYGAAAFAISKRTARG